MNYDIIVPVRFLFKRKPDNAKIVGVSSLHLTHKEHELLTDELTLKLLREQGYNVIRIIHEDENIINANFGMKF